jgi:hypothetical protein
MMRGRGRRFGIRPMRFRRGLFMPYMWRPYCWWPRLFIMGSFLYFLFGSRPYKVHRDKVTLIEQETGKKAKDLNEEELVSTMKKMGIKCLEISDDEIIAIERAERKNILK